MLKHFFRPPSVFDQGLSSSTVCSIVRHKKAHSPRQIRSVSRRTETLLAVSFPGPAAAVPAFTVQARPYHERSLPSDTDLVSMNEQEKFLFDLNGFLVVRNVLTPQEVDELNAAVDAHQASGEHARPREDPALKNARPGSAMSAAGSRVDVGGLLGWDTPGFRRLLAHPKIVPYLNDLCGAGYRMDHQPFVISQSSESEGFALHGGPLVPNSDPARKTIPELAIFSPELQYRWSGGRFFNSLLAMSVQLCDTAEGDGGFCVVRGSHKLNYAIPADFANGAFGREHVYQTTTKKGDIVFFSEATAHGALPWRAQHERRVALYRFAPPTFCYGRSYLDEWGEGVLAKCTEAEKCVLLGPFANRVERPYLVVVKGAVEGGVDVVEVRKEERNPVKKEHDREIFGTPWF